VQIDYAHRVKNLLISGGKMKCKICGKPEKENTLGNLRYCQGHIGGFSNYSY